MSLQTLQNINTTHRHSKNYTVFLSNKKSITNSVSSHTKHLQINNLHNYLYNSLSFPSHSTCFYKIFWFTCSFHSICPIITWQKSFLCHRSTTLEFTLSWYPKLVFSTNIAFLAQNTPLQNCVHSIGFFPSPLWILILPISSILTQILTILKGNSLKRTKQIYTSNSLANSFMNRCVNCWNALPSSTVLSPILPQFKTLTNKFDFSTFFRGWTLESSLVCPSTPLCSHSPCFAYMPYILSKLYYVVIVIVCILWFNLVGFFIVFNSFQTLAVI